MSKLGMLAAGAVGYVLGARAGRERYDQIVTSAQRLWSNPKVQEASQQAQLYAREKAPEVGEKLSDAAVDVAKAAAVKVTEVVGSSDNSGSGSRVKVERSTAWAGLKVSADCLAKLPWDDYEFIQRGYGS